MGRTFSSTKPDGATSSARTCIEAALQVRTRTRRAASNELRCTGVHVVLVRVSSFVGQSFGDRSFAEFLFLQSVALVSVSKVTQVFCLSTKEFSISLSFFSVNLATHGL